MARELPLMRSFATLAISVLGFLAPATHAADTLAGLQSDWAEISKEEIAAYEAHRLAPGNRGYEAARVALMPQPPALPMIRAVSEPPYVARLRLVRAWHSPCGLPWSR